MSNDDLMEQLEKLVDARSLAAVVSTLSDICEAKAEHIESNWQDKTLAKEWRKNGKRLDKLSFEIYL